jgi:uncharacterized repeat protein (TIGR01451 family)
MFGQFGAQAADPVPPFTECPAAGQAPSCNVLIVFNANGTVGIFQGQPKRIDDDEDTLVGVRNSTGASIPNVVLSSTNPNIHPFAFDGDGMCSTAQRSQPRPAGCPYQTSGTGADYAGPGITYTEINAAKTSGKVNFAKSCTQTTTCTASNGLSAGKTVFFSLEDKVDAGNIVVPGVITSQKTASKTTANVGDVITYTIKLSNSGSAAGTTDVIDDYDEAHLSNITDISNGGVNNSPSAGKIKWTGVSVPPGSNTVTLSYKGTVSGTFSGGNGSCGPNKFPLVNTVQLSNGQGTTNTVCVSQGVITSSKTASPNPAVEGDTVTYTIKLSNSGTSASTTDVIDDYDETHLTNISNISNGGVNNSPSAGKIKWTAVSVPPGTNTVTLSYKGKVTGPFSGSHGTCGPDRFPVTNSVTLSNGTGTSNTLCVSRKPTMMTGHAFALNLGGLIPIGPLGETGPVATTVPSSDSFCEIPLDLTVVIANLLCSSVDTTTVPNTSTAHASIAKVIVALPGAPIIEARLIESDSTTTCAGSEGSTTIAYLAIGDSVIIDKPTAIAPNTVVIPADPLLTVTLNEQLPVDGADKGLTVNAVHVTVGGGDLIDLILASSTTDMHDC